MIILYKICFNEDRALKIKETPKARPVVKDLSNMINTCLTSIVKQMTQEDKIVFFLDGEDIDNTINNICSKYNVNYTTLTYNYNDAVKINNECSLYIINEIDNENEIIYLCEDDYLHYNNCLDHIKDFFTQYPSYFCHPTDYPNLYTNNKQLSEIITTKNWHWRSIKSTTYTFAFKTHMFKKYYDIFTNTNERMFWAHLCNIMYINDKCFSPIPSLTTHMEEGCFPPCVNTKKEFAKI